MSLLLCACNDQKSERSRDVSFSRDASAEISAAFVEGNFPNRASRTYEKRQSIGIAIEDDTIVAVERRYIKSWELKVDNGRFIGVGRGEWSGNIKFKPNSGIEYDILQENCLGLCAVGEKKYALTGLAHLSTDYGSIYELIFSKGKWKTEKILDIGNEPQAYIVVDEDLYVVTRKALIVLKEGDFLETLVEDAFWGGSFPYTQNGVSFSSSLTPNSMVYANHSIYIGMYGGIYAYDLNTREEKWYDYSGQT